MPSRRTLLKGAVAATVAAGGSLAYLARGATTAHAATQLPLTVVNTTSYADSDITLYVVGSDLTTGEHLYVGADGKPVPVTLDLNGPDGFADLSIPFGTGGKTMISLPNMSGRVYVAIKDKLKFKVVSDGTKPALQFPAGWTPTDPSYNVLHDCMEFTFSDSGMFCNTTMVDMLSIPMAIQLVGAATQTTGTLPPDGRAKIFAALAALPDYSQLVQGDLRVIAPGHGIDAAQFSTTYYDEYIDSVWQKYSAEDMTVQTEAATFTGRVTGDSFVFDGGTSPIAKPTTRDVFFCDGALAAPNDGTTGPLAAMLGAGFNRSTLLETPSQPITDAAQYYQDPITNHYSRVIHENTVDGKAYGFAFDDVLSQASYIQDAAPTAITLTLTPVDSAGQPSGTPTASASSTPSASASSTPSASASGTPSVSAGPA
jgi:hypothetical protein